MNIKEFSEKGQSLIHIKREISYGTSQSTFSTFVS